MVRQCHINIDSSVPGSCGPPFFVVYYFKIDEFRYYNPEFQTSTDLSLGSLQFENLSLESLSFYESESILSDRFLQRNCIGDNSLHLPPVSQSVSESISSDRFLKQNCIGDNSVADISPHLRSVSQSVSTVNTPLVSFVSIPTIQGVLPKKSKFKMEVSCMTKIFWLSTRQWSKAFERVRIVRHFT